MSHPALSDEDKVFLRAILASPAEQTAWLAYADWLDEHADPRAEFIRLEVQFTSPEATQTDRYGIIARLEELRSALDPDWVAIFDRPRVENCDELFAFKCPRKWERLAGTDDPNVRRCDSCQKEVYYCQSLTEAYDHARQGDCVAVATGVDRFPSDLERDPRDTAVRTLGMMRLPAPEPEPPRRPWWKFW